MLASFSAEELVGMGVRVGTVHSFQGNERDAIVCSLGLDDDRPAGWSFVADPHLLAVMLTRARSSMTLTTSGTPEPSSILGRYVATADHPPGTPAPVGPLSAWGNAVLDDLRLAGVAAQPSYPTGRHTVDIAATAATQPVAIVCDLHPDGIDAHIERRLALLTLGWHVVSALGADWEDRRPDLILELVDRLDATS